MSKKWNAFEQQNITEVRSTDPRGVRLYFLAVWPWLTWTASLIVGFLDCKVGVTLVPGTSSAVTHSWTCQPPLSQGCCAFIPYSIECSSPREPHASPPYFLQFMPKSFCFLNSELVFSIALYIYFRCLFPPLKHKDQWNMDLIYSLLEHHLCAWYICAEWMNERLMDEWMKERKECVEKETVTSLKPAEIKPHRLCRLSYGIYPSSPKTEGCNFQGMFED